MSCALSVLGEEEQEDLSWPLIDPYKDTQVSTQIFSVISGEGKAGQGIV